MARTDAAALRFPSEEEVSPQIKAEVLGKFLSGI
jgi:hypothetical protein